MSLILPAMLYSEEGRRATFFHEEKSSSNAGKKKSKKKTKKRPVSRWPINGRRRCNPRNLAKAGFFFCPANGEGDDEGDLVQCFMCGKQLDQWEPSDDPMKEHAKHAPSCPFLNLHIEANRLLTFKHWDQTHLRATPEDFSKAGFYWDPSEDSTDNVKCFQCNKCLAGWEKDDVPM